MEFLDQSGRTETINLSKADFHLFKTRLTVLLGGSRYPMKNRCNILEAMRLD